MAFPILYDPRRSSCRSRPRGPAVARPRRRAAARGDTLLERHGLGRRLALHADQRPERQRRPALRARPRRLALARRHLRHRRRRPGDTRRPPGRGRAQRRRPRAVRVNAGSDSVSVFRTGHRGPRLVARVPSRGVAPTSVAEHHGRVYVLNSGGTANVAAYGAASMGRSRRSPAGRASSRPARSARRRSPSRLTAGRSSSASGSPTGSRRCRSTSSGAPARPS